MHYFPFRPAEKIVASWTAVERVDQNNGCLYVIPASHKGPLYEHTYPNVRVDDSFTHKVFIKLIFQGIKNKLYHGVQGLDHLKKHYVVMDKGDTVFFHPHLLHGSGPNRTQVWYFIYQNNQKSLLFYFINTIYQFFRDSEKLYHVTTLTVTVTLQT